MGKKSGAKHLKRMPSPAFWPGHRKEFLWAPKPSPGPHPAEMSLPLSVVVRDSLQYARTAREARMIISEGKLRVDGKIRRDRKYPAGLMDVIEFPDANTTFRILPIAGKGLGLVRTTKDEAKAKLCRIDGKTTLRAGSVQLNLHDGRNLLLKVKDPRNPSEDVYETQDTLRISLPGQKILNHFRFAEGAYALIFGGRNLGKHGKVVKIEKGSATRPSVVTLESSEGERLQTVADYVFIVGDEKPAIRLEGGV